MLKFQKILFFILNTLVNFYKKKRGRKIVHYVVNSKDVDFPVIGKLVRDYYIKGKELPPIEVYLRQDFKYEVVNQNIFYAYIITNHVTVCKVRGSKESD